MKKASKKGFTLVELIIVLLLLAILAAVLIPVFYSLGKKNNITSDTQLIRNLNEAVAIDKAEKKIDKHDTMYDAVKACEKQGYLVDVIVAKKSSYNIAWERSTGNFILLDMSSNKVVYPVSVTENKEYTATVKADYYVVTKSGDFNSVNGHGYSTYAYGEGWDTVETAKGFDVGDVKTITVIDYKNAVSGQNVIIRTNTFGTRLNVDGTLEDTVLHYGFAGLVDVVKVANNSYEEYGTIGRLTANSTGAVGHIAIKSGAIVYQMVEGQGDTTYVTKDANAIVYDVDGEKVTGEVDTRKAGEEKDMFAEDAPITCEHTDTHIFSDGQYMYEVCDVCGYTLITVDISKKSVSDGEDNVITPIEGYATKQVQVATQGGNVVIKEGEEPVVPTPIVDPEEPITQCEHDFGEMVIITRPTTTSNGLGKYTCSKCEYSYTVILTPAVVCTHEYHSEEEINEHLTNVVWETVTIGGVTKELKATCLEDGVIKSAHCKDCDEDISNIKVKAYGHKNSAVISQKALDGDNEDVTATCKSIYCTRCHMPVAFIDEVETFTALSKDKKTEYEMDVAYSFKAFSNDKLEFRDEDGNVRTTKFSNLSLYEIMYGYKVESTTVKGLMSEDLLNMLLAIKDLEKDSVKFEDITDSKVRQGLLDDYKKTLITAFQDNFDLFMVVFGVNVDDVNPLGAVKYFAYAADFEISFNKDVDKTKFGLGGYYESYGSLGFIGSEFAGEGVLEKYTSVEMLTTAFKKFVVDYKFLLKTVGEFKCGVFNNGIAIDPADPLTATVSLFIRDYLDTKTKTVITSVAYDVENVD